MVNLLGFRTVTRHIYSTRVLMLWPGDTSSSELILSCVQNLPDNILRARRGGISWAGLLWLHLRCWRTARPSCRPLPHLQVSHSLLSCSCLQCCGSGIQCLFDLWTGTGMNHLDRISESLETIFGVKILKFLWCRCGSGSWIRESLWTWIRDPGMKKFGIAMWQLSACHVLAVSFYCVDFTF